MDILILGGGISGLSAAWYAWKKHPGAKITLLEKTGRLGGSIETVQREGVFFERGPRTFVASRSESLRALIEEVGLGNEIIASDTSAAKRYLWSRGKLRSILSFLPTLLPAMVREPFLAKGECDDESISDFATRRFSRKIADTLFDSMTLGVFAGDIRKLSLRTCFPLLHQWEQEKGSVLRGMFSQPKGKQGLFTLQRGMESLIDAIAQKVPIRIVMHTPVESIEPGGVVAQGEFWRADQIISALPGPVIGRLTGMWGDFPARSLWVVSIVFPPHSMAKKGFGYLVPTEEGEPLLGAIWDSSIFPQQTVAREIRITAMVRACGGAAAQAQSAALDALRRHLGIRIDPLFSDAHFAHEAIPQFEVGYAKRLARFQSEIKQKFPSLSLIGNYLEGPSVDACVRTAKRLLF